MKQVLMVLSMISEKHGTAQGVWQLLQQNASGCKIYQVGEKNKASQLLNTFALGLLKITH